MSDELHGPTFRVGDKVKVRGFGDSQFKITGLLSTDGIGYIYELNGLNRYYTEDLLEHVTENKDEYSTIDFEINFDFDDTVTVKGYGDDRYKVEGYRTESWHYKDEEWTDVIYELSRVTDGTWLEATDEDMQITEMTEGESARISKESEVVTMLDEVDKRKERERLEDIDKCLDAINTCDYLYKLTGEDGYLYEEAKAYDRLRELTKRSG